MSLKIYVHIAWAYTLSYTDCSRRTCITSATRDREMFAALNYKFGQTIAAIKSRNYTAPIFWTSEIYLLF